MCSQTTAGCGGSAVIPGLRRTPTAATIVGRRSGLQARQPLWTGSFYRGVRLAATACTNRVPDPRDLPPTEGPQVVLVGALPQTYGVRVDRQRPRQDRSPCGRGAGVKGCASTLLVLAALGAGGYAVYSHPGWTMQATQGAQHAAAWVSGQLAVRTPAAPSPTVDQASDPAPVSSGTPNPTATPTPPAIVLTVPSATPRHVVVVVWSAADCTWAEQVMSWDYQLDANEADAIAAGRDTRYGTSSSVVDYYRTYAIQWDAVVWEIRGQCGSPVIPITSTQADTALTWFAHAIAAHVADEDDATPSAAQWDVQWIGYYQRLTSMFQQLVG